MRNEGRTSDSINALQISLIMASKAYVLSQLHFPSHIPYLCIPISRHVSHVHGEVEETPATSCTVATLLGEKEDNVPSHPRHYYGSSSRQRKLTASLNLLKPWRCIVLWLIWWGLVDSGTCGRAAGWQVSFGSCELRRAGLT